MGFQQHDFIEPEQPKESRWLLWLGVGAVVLVLIGACIVGAALFWDQFQERTAAPPTLVIPTSPVQTAVPDPTDPPFAATATLIIQESITAVPLGPGDVVASQWPTPPAVDGHLSEWGDVAGTESAFRVYSHSDWDGTDDVSAVWQLGWDADNLYFAVSVTDDAHVQTQSGNQIFRGDSVDMQIDTDRNGDYGDGVSPDDFQIIFSPGDFAGLPSSAFRFRGTAGGQMSDATGHSIVLAAQPTDVGYNLEAAVPWRDLSMTPASGSLIGLALNVSDNDVPGTAVQELMKSHVSTRQFGDPRTWGTLTLK